MNVYLKASLIVIGRFVRNFFVMALMVISAVGVISILWMYPKYTVEPVFALLAFLGALLAFLGAIHYIWKGVCWTTEKLKKFSAYVKEGFEKRVDRQVAILLDPNLLKREKWDQDLFDEKCRVFARTSSMDLSDQEFEQFVAKHGPRP